MQGLWCRWNFKAKETKTYLRGRQGQLLMASTCVLFYILSAHLSPQLLLQRPVPRGHLTILHRALLQVHATFFLCCHSCDGMELPVNALGTQASMAWSVGGGLVTYGTDERPGQKHPQKVLYGGCHVALLNLIKTHCLSDFLSSSVSLHLSFPPASWGHLPSELTSQRPLSWTLLGETHMDLSNREWISSGHPELHSFLISFRNHSV